MITSENSIDVSSAEEINENNDKIEESSILESALTSTLSFSKSCPHFCERNSTNQYEEDTKALYDVIQQHHIKIVDLHVDSSLKPCYLSHNHQETVLNSNTESKRRDSIIQFLRSGSRYQPNISDKYKTLSDSISPQVNRRYFDRDKSSTNSSGELNFQDNFNDISGEAFMDQLEFQVNMKNERAHFLLSDMLMHSIQHLLSELQLQRSKKPNKQNTVDPEYQYTNVDKSSTLSNRADKLAASIIDDVTALSTQIHAQDLWLDKCLPLNLNCEFNNLRQTDVSNSAVDPSERPSMSTQQMTIQSQYSTSGDLLLQNSSDQIIKTAVGYNCNASNIQVGGCPMLTSEWNLPSFIATQLPPYRTRSQLLSYQQQTCPGCHGPLPPEMTQSAKRLRLCRYYGMLFCSSCHSNTLMLIPARILNYWDFTMLAVSRPARDLLNFIHCLPLFSVTEHVAPRVRDNVRAFAVVARLRTQATHLITFIGACRQGGPLMQLAEKLPVHWISSAGNCPLNSMAHHSSSMPSVTSQLMSMSDLRLLDTGEMEKWLKHFVTASIEHVSLCPLCQARGFICELCSTNQMNQTGSNSSSTDVLFPFEIDRVVQCSECYACAHLECVKEHQSKAYAKQADQDETSGSILSRDDWCLRCYRIRNRQNRSPTYFDLIDSAVDNDHQ